MTNILNKDLRYLIHFLKEKHSLKEYLLKSNKQIKTVIQWYIFLNNRKIYYGYLPIYENNNLFNSVKIFNFWMNEPYTLSDSAYYEDIMWSQLSSSFYKTKQLIKLIYNYHDEK